MSLIIVLGVAGLFFISLWFCCKRSWHKRMLGQIQEFWPQVSLVLFLHNSEENLEWLVRRLMMLSYGNYADFEVVLIDRGSTDRTAKISALLERDYPTVRFVRVGTSWVKVYEEIWQQSASAVVFMEEIKGLDDCNSFLHRAKALLKSKKIWDYGPNKIETQGEYTKFRQNDTI